MTPFKRFDLELDAVLLDFLPRDHFEQRLAPPSRNLEQSYDISLKVNDSYLECSGLHAFQTRFPLNIGHRNVAESPKV